ncbi:MAG: threonine synthase [Pseudomonadota bacterium]|nr:threonine synthase [Pseudomonadota bacterium]
MRYLSTRGKAPILEFADVLLAGLANDGGLYVPETWPRFSKADIRAMRGLSYDEVAFRVMEPYVDGAIDEAAFQAMIEDAYKEFGHPATAPSVQIGENLWLTELFHGPTLAFKDYPLQLVGRLFDYVLKARGQRVTIIGATSGDTGSAAIEACRDRDAIEIFIFHPEGRVSDVQRRQMTTVASPNVHNIALEGTFDDCQDMVKALFADKALARRHKFSAVNSINWSRIMAQFVYYFWAALNIGAPDRRIAFAVPTGNFGNVFAAYGARRMGLPVEKLIIGSNANDILTRYLENGVMEMRDVVPTVSPSMDIQVSSNFERLLFEYYHRDGAGVAKVMEQFRRTGRASFGKGRWRAMSKLFEGHCADDHTTKAVISGVYQDTGQLLDPHTAIGVEAGRRASRASDVAVIAMATAHPAKFLDAIRDVTGTTPELPRQLADLLTKDELYETLPNDIERVSSYLEQRLASRASAGNKQ